MIAEEKQKKELIRSMRLNISLTRLRCIPDLLPLQPKRDLTKSYEIPLQ